MSWRSTPTPGRARWWRTSSSKPVAVPRPAAERPAEPAALSRLLKLLFSLRRKQLGGILKPYGDLVTGTWLADAGIDPRDRPENLSPEQLSQLAILLKTRLGS